MHKLLRKIISFVILIFTLTCLFPSSKAMNEAPYNSYWYDTWEQPRQTTSAYIPQKIISGKSAGSTELIEPTYLTVVNNETYILDAGNNRIVVLDKNLEFNRELTPKQKDDKPLKMQEPTHMFLDTQTNTILISDKAVGVYVFDKSLNLIEIVKAPKSKILPEGFLFSPVQAIRDSTGILYVVSENCYLGALQFDENNEFIGFFGSQKVALTFDTMVNYLWKQVLSDEQAANMKRLVPTEFTGFTIDDEDFVYTIQNIKSTSDVQMKKLNALGENILTETVIGDIKAPDYQLKDIAIDSNGFINIIDSISGKILQYNSQGKLLYIFGDKGNQIGLLQEPVAIDSLGKNLIVLDKKTGLIHCYKPTRFAENIRQASSLMDNGKYIESMETWKQVINEDPFYEFANLGLGKAHEGMAEFKQASKYYKNANQKQLYSIAYGEVRRDWIFNNFALFMILVAAIIASVVGLILYRRKKTVNVYGMELKEQQYPLYCLIHPVTGFSDMKERKKDSGFASAILLVIFFVVSILHQQLTGFAFNKTRIDQFSLPFTFISTIGILLAFVICNWSITTISDGNGKLGEVFNYCAYALLPYIIMTILIIVLSNVLTTQEQLFVQAGYAIRAIWTGAAIIIALKEVHLYSFGKTMWTSILTIAGLLVILIIVAISYNVVTQFIEFIGNIITEIRIW